MEFLDIWIEIFWWAGHVRPSYIVDAHNNGETYVSNVSGFGFRHFNVTQFSTNRKSNFMYLKERIETKLMLGPVLHIIHQNPVFFLKQSIQMFPAKDSRWQRC